MSQKVTNPKTDPPTKPDQTKPGPGPNDPPATPSDDFKIIIEGLESSNLDDKTKQTLAAQALEIDSLKKENIAAKKDNLIKQLNDLEVDTKGYAEKYDVATLKGMVEMKQAEVKASNTLKTNATGGDPNAAANLIDPGWFDHTPMPGYPNGVWRSSIDDSVLKDARNRNIEVEQRAK